MRTDPQVHVGVFPPQEDKRMEIEEAGREGSRGGVGKKTDVIKMKKEKGKEKVEEEKKKEKKKRDPTPGPSETSGKSLIMFLYYFLEWYGLT